MANDNHQQMCPKHGTDFLEYKCRYCCSVAVFFCFGTTHFCNACHDDFQRMTSIPKEELPHCPAGIVHFSSIYSNHSQRAQRTQRNLLFLNKLRFWNRFQKFTTLYYFAMQVCKNQSRLYLWSSTIIGAQCLSRFEPYQQCNWFYKVKEEKLGFFSHSSMLGNDLMQLYIWQ